MSYYVVKILTEYNGMLSDSLLREVIPYTVSKGFLERLKQSSTMF